MDVKPFSPADVANRKGQALRNAVLSIVNHMLCSNDQHIIYEDELNAELIRYPLDEISGTQLHGIIYEYRAEWKVTYDDGAGGFFSASWQFEPLDAA